MLDVETQRRLCKGKWETLLFDLHFSNQNQTHNYHQIFLEYHCCIKNMNQHGKSTIIDWIGRGISGTSCHISRILYLFLKYFSFFK
uniref:Uncharacterized protein n=1 Tax=Urocitellus parryii TaxID=9999 RepID=A0A8D2GXF1_UROPR